MFSKWSKTKGKLKRCTSEPTMKLHTSPSYNIKRTEKFIQDIILLFREEDIDISYNQASGLCAHFVLDRFSSSNKPLESESNDTSINDTSIFTKLPPNITVSDFEMYLYEKLDKESMF